MIEIRQRRIAATCLVAGLMLRHGAWAQDAAPRRTSQQKPGVFESIGRWFDNGASNFRDHLRGAKREMDELGDDAAANNKAISDQRPKWARGRRRRQGRGGRHHERDGRHQNAMGAVAKLPIARMMTGASAASPPPNGARTASRRRRRFAASTASPPARAWTSPQPRNAQSERCSARSDECTTVTFISRAMCQ